MIVKIKRGEPVNAVLEVDSNNVVRQEIMNRGGRLYMGGGEMYALNSVEWAQWVAGKEPDVADMVFDPVPWEKDSFQEVRKNKKKGKVK
jgi:hypothetical protein